MNFELLLSIVKYSPIEFSIHENELIFSVPVFGVSSSLLHSSGFWTVFDGTMFEVDWNDHDQLCEWYYIPL